MVIGLEVVTQNNSQFKSLHGLLKDYPDIKKPAIENYSSKLAALYAMLKTAEKMQPPGKLLDSTEQDLRKKSIAAGVSEEVINASELLYHFGIAIHSPCRMMVIYRSA